MKAWIRPIKKMGACIEALGWAEDYNSLQEAWEVCERGDWMLWLLGKRVKKIGTLEHKKLVLIACQCARLALPYVQGVEKRPLKAVETVEAWAKGDTSISMRDLKAAGAGAAGAAEAAAWAAGAAARAAGAAARAAWATAWAAGAAAWAARATWATAWAAGAAEATALKKCADIVREHYSTLVEIKVKED